VLPLIPWLIGNGNAARNASIVIGLVAAGAVGALLAVFTERSIIRTALRQIFWATLACSLTWVIGAWLGATVL
ncbi:MAG: hypothetical protein OER95_09645, partial [Acidimicrobiia bacterium]|nr:hypothetical protein [Acidimicrobiia bacterium]